MQAINTCYTEKTKTKREAGKELLVRILNVKSVPLNFFTIGKAAANTVAPWPMPLRQF
jgi:hypothetical protein